VGHSPLESSGLPLFFLVSPAPGGIQPTPRGPGAAAVRVVARSLSVMQKEALVANSSTGAVWRLASEEGPCDPQGRRAPDPLSYASAGIAFCFMAQVARYARILRRGLQGLAVVQDTGFRPGGSADPVVTHVDLETAEDDAFAQQLVAAGERTCFLHALCRTALEVEVQARAGR